MAQSMRKLVPNYLFPLLALLAPLTMGVRDCEDAKIGMACMYEGKSYAVGETVGERDCGACTCGADGTVLCPLIHCFQKCGGSTGLTCPDTEYCESPPSPACGAADQTGTCSMIPDACVTVDDPVCGCDDKTYSNSCSAAMAEVSVASTGACGTTDCTYDGKGYSAGDTFDASDGCNSCSCDADGSVACTEIGCVNHCGGIAGLSCTEGEFCDYPPIAQCGAADQTGTCQVKPEACILLYAPVCGCDGKTYGNACSAGAAGVSVASESECGAAVASCGGRGAAQCGIDEFCDFPTTAKCGRADAPGSCTTTPEFCTDDYTPVCGCNGLTYSNTCNASAAGISVDFKGECDATRCEFDGKTYAAGDHFDSSDGCNTCTCSGSGLVACTERACQVDFCGGIAGSDCNEGEFCNYPLDTACGSGDQTGTCQVPPGDCTLQYDPVCGCDGKDYGNPCGALAAGTSVSSEGVCE